MNLKEIIIKQDEEFEKERLDFADTVILVGFGGDEVNGYKGKFNEEAEEVRNRDYDEAKDKLYSYLYRRDHAIAEAVREEIIDSLPRKFWEDEDHAVGGYISKKDLWELLNKKI